MKPASLLILVQLAGLSAFAASTGEAERAALAAQLHLEDRLVAEATARLSELRRQETDALQALKEAAEAVDQAVTTARPRIEDIERRALDREVAQAALGVLSRRVGEAQARLIEHLRRQALLRLESEKAPAEAVKDPISGRWRVDIASPAASGIFELKLEGNQLSGTWSLGLRRGTLRGSFAARRLRLERLDPGRGLDGVFEGEIDPLLGTARGVWTPVELAVGEAGGSSWSAVRLTEAQPAPEDAQPEQEDEELEPR